MPLMQFFRLVHLFLTLPRLADNEGQYRHLHIEYDAVPLDFQQGISGTLRDFGIANQVV